MVSAFGKVYPEDKLNRLVILRGRSRMIFAVRENVQAQLAHWAGVTNAQAVRDKTIQCDPYLRPLYNAYVTLRSKFESLQGAPIERIAGLSNFIHQHVKWVNNLVPQGLDLNRLFITMNTGGVQLEQSDILKAALLRKMSQDRHHYDAIWQACENMNNYFERNLRKVFPNANWGRLRYDELATYDRGKFPLEKPARGTNVGMSIAELAATSNRATEKKFVETKVNVDDTDVYCRSIIGFPLLLIHAFRIFQKRKGQTDIETRVIDSQLNRCFSKFLETAAEREVKEFLRCLWEVRYQFDRWVIKWVRTDIESEEHLCLAAVHFDKSKGRLSRKANKMTDLVQLESVRNFSGERSAQYWLTPFLGYLSVEKLTKLSEVEELLEEIDDQLSLATCTQKEASFILIDDDCQNLRDIDEVCEELSTPKGTAFEHYWFQKLEYVLWRRRQADVHLFDPDKLDAYRITSKNSIEHVHPRNEKYDSQIGDESLHSFGNLVLLSPGENSSYSNKPVPVKREDFRAKPRYDALKLAHIFEKKKQEAWDANTIASHQKDMLQFLHHHYVDK